MNIAVGERTAQGEACHDQDQYLIFLLGQTVRPCGRVSLHAGAFLL
jgi:hypothetical protein